jgi:hypothetical protein
MTLLQRNSISSYDGLVESQAWLRTIPVNELANRMVVGAQLLLKPMEICCF